MKIIPVYQGGQQRIILKENGFMYKYYMNIIVVANFKTKSVDDKSLVYMCHPNDISTHIPEDYHELAILVYGLNHLDEKEITSWL